MSNQEHYYYIYITTNESNSVLYTGVTNDLKKRIYQHREKLLTGFTKRYNINKLVYYEIYNDPETAIEREKQLKNWNRKKKIMLITKMNPKFDELTLDRLV